MPDLAIFQTVSVGVKNSQESKLCTYAKVRNYNIEDLVEKLIFANFLCQVLSEHLLLFYILLSYQTVLNSILFFNVLLGCS